MASEGRVQISGARGMYGASLCGKREIDEDFIACGEFGPVRVAVICDGMGGMERGEDASEIVARGFVKAIGSLAAKSPQKWSVENWRHGAYKKLIARCHDSVDEMAGGRGVSGTTITALVFTVSHGITPQVDIVNLGDSRCYKMDEEGTSLLTHDHSLTGDMARAGYIEIHEIPDTAGSSALTRNVGDEARSEPDLFTINLTEEAGFILCCDGVWDPLHGPEGLWLPDCNPFSQKAADLIVEEAIKRGSTDNCSVLIFNPGIES